MLANQYHRLVEKGTAQITTVQQQLTFEELPVRAHIPSQSASLPLDSQKENRWVREI
jgi:hypothetical protein